MDGILTGGTLETIAAAWLAEFDAALADGRSDRIAGLFAAESHWRDILAFGWDLRTISGAEAIA